MKWFKISTESNSQDVMCEDQSLLLRRRLTDKSVMAILRPKEAKGSSAREHSNIWAKPLYLLSIIISAHIHIDVYDCALLFYSQLFNIIQCFSSGHHHHHRLYFPLRDDRPSTKKALGAKYCLRRNNHHISPHYLHH